MPDPKKKMTKKVSPMPQSGRDIPLPQTTMGSVRRPDDIGPNRMPKPNPSVTHNGFPMDSADALHRKAPHLFSQPSEGAYRTAAKLERKKGESALASVPASRSAVKYGREHLNRANRYDSTANAISRKKRGY